MDKSYDAILFVLSAQSISGATFQIIQTEITCLTDLPAKLIRLEQEGSSLFEALDQLRSDGAQAIRVQPIGFPFPENLLNWLPGVLSFWQAQAENSAVSVTLAATGNQVAAFTRQILQQSVDLPLPPVSDVPIAPALGKPGWQNPPDFDYHLLVCVGPRCQIYGATPFVQKLEQTIRRAGIRKRCLITKTNCLYPCNRGPVLALYPQGDWYHLPDQDSIDQFVTRVLLQQQPLSEYRYHRARLAAV